MSTGILHMGTALRHFTSTLGALHRSTSFSLILIVSTGLARPILTGFALTLKPPRDEPGKLTGRAAPGDFLISQVSLLWHAALFATPGSFAAL